MRNRKMIALILFLASFVSLSLPIMRVYCSGVESGTILVRIFNLAEFSPAGFVTILAPILMLPTLLFRLPVKAKCLTTVSIAVVDVVCTALAGKTAYTWLTEIGAKNFRLQPVSILYFLTIAATVLMIVLPKETGECDTTADHIGNHGFRLEGELREVPMTLRRLAEWNRSINIVSAYAREMPDEELHKHLNSVLDIACDFLCNTCYDYHVDPFILDYWDGKSENVIVTPFKPETEV